MWIKLILLITITWMISTSQSAVVQCKWNGDQCLGILTMTPVTQINEDITVAGKPAGFISTSTTSLNFEFLSLKYVPTNIFKVFPSLTMIYIYNSSTTALLTDSFTNCASMLSVGIMYGNIPYVSEGFVQTCINTQHVWLGNDNIEAIDKNAFRGLPKLNFLYLKDNKITCLHSDLFQHTPLLQNIYLEKNRIAGIDRNLFRNLKNLSRVTMEDNLIRYLPTLTLTPGNVNGMGLSLYRNPIYAIKPDFCSTFTNGTTALADRIDLKLSNEPGNIPCLPAGSTLNQISRWNCASSASILQSCYANYTTAMSDTISCESNSICIPAATWYKLLNFLKTLF